MKPVIKGTNIHRSFCKGDITTHVLRGIDIEIAEGEYVAIMGKSGAGKSTLLYQLSALDEPSEGAIRVADVALESLTERQRTAFRLRTLGFVFQDYALVPDLSALENVLLPLLMRGTDWDVAEAEAKKALTAVGLGERFCNLPGQLSGGEQQRVAIARAVVGKPRILFADEPTANLDSVSGTMVIDLISKLHREYNLTIVMVTHEAEYTRDVERIVEMEDGRIVGERRPREKAKRAKTPKTAEEKPAPTKTTRRRSPTKAKAEPKATPKAKSKSRTTKRTRKKKED